MDPTPDEIIGARIRQRRIALGKSLKDVGGDLSMHFTTVGKFETGKMRFTPAVIDKFAETLRISAYWLTTGIVDPVAESVDVYANQNLDAKSWFPPGGQAPTGIIPIPELPEDSSREGDPIPGHCYALLAEGGINDLDRALGPWCMVVSPGAQEMTPGEMYAIILEGETSASFIIPTHDPLGICFWPSGLIEPFGQRAFFLIGKIIYQTRNIGIPLRDPVTSDVDDE